MRGLLSLYLLIRSARGFSFKNLEDSLSHPSLSSSISEPWENSRNDKSVLGCLSSEESECRTNFDHGIFWEFECPVFSIYILDDDFTRSDSFTNGSCESSWGRVCPNRIAKRELMVSWEGLREKWLDFLSDSESVSESSSEKKENKKYTNHAHERVPIEPPDVSDISKGKNSHNTDEHYPCDRKEDISELEVSDIFSEVREEHHREENPCHHQQEEKHDLR